MSKYQGFIWLFIPLVYLLSTCSQRPSVDKNALRHFEPDYNLVKIESSSDTLHFKLDDSTYNQVETVNIFFNNGIEYYSFYDDRSESINIYELTSGKKVKKILLNPLFKKDGLYRTSVFVRNFDSILIANNTSLYLFDSSGLQKASIPFLERARYIKAELDNVLPPVVLGAKIYTGVRRSIDASSVNELREWKTFYEFDFVSNKAQLHYNLPKMYQIELYGYHYLYNSYCYNFNNKFVLSFAADSMIYETDLINYNFAYFGKSQYDSGSIKPISKEMIKKDEDSKHFRIHGSYGPIYYDQHNNRYLRVFRQKISEEEYNRKNISQIQSLIVFDKNLKIIGETQVNENINLSAFFFTRNGNIYAQVNRKDEYALHFVKLTYSENDTLDRSINKNKLLSTR